MGEEEYIDQLEPAAKPRNGYFAGLALFLLASLILTVWSFVTLATQ